MHHLLYLLVLSAFVGVLGEHENFCKPLEDYGPRSDTTESRHVCKTEMKKNCQQISESGCLEVTELRCEVMLTTNCTMDWTNKDKIESVMSVKERSLKNCTKEMQREFHNKTVYDCKNVTKVHCTTLWTIDDNGEKVWAGNEDDCRDVTWEECFPVSKQVPMLVAHMNCVDVPVSYFDYENVTTQAMADSLDCQISKVPICEPLTTTKCDEVTYTKCQEVPETVCTTVDIPVPSQPILHKQWCLFDQEDDIDFDKQVRKITQEANLKEAEAEALLKEAEAAYLAETLALQETERSRPGFGNLQSILGGLDPIFEDFTDSNTGSEVVKRAEKQRKPRVGRRTFKKVQPRRY